MDEYLKGSSYRENSSSTGVSLGAVSSVVGEAKNMYPDLEHLRELRSKLPQDVDIPALNRAVSSVLELQGHLGIDIEHIPEYLEDKRKEIGGLSKRIQSLKAEVSELASKRDSLRSEINTLLDKKAQLLETGTHTQTIVHIAICNTGNDLSHASLNTVCS